MRPQHITAENVKSLREIAAMTPASMRPQHITAENAYDAAAAAYAAALQ